MLSQDRDLLAQTPAARLADLPLSRLLFLLRFLRPLVRKSVAEASQFGARFRRIDQH